EKFRLKAEMKKEYTVKDIDYNFRKELSEEVGAKSLLQCIGCGICSSGCTVSEFIDLQPHRMVACCLLGLKDFVLKSNAVWICSLCHKCTERCPKHVDYSLLLAHLRNLAVKEGNVPDEFVTTLENLSEGGLAVPFSGFIKDSVKNRREAMGLPALTEAPVDELNDIIKSVGLENLIKKKESDGGDD
ncbi:MAG: hypothetical protein GF364_12760, partial [Candidatus Lokiarchaeota archaeon]|nr:hypothetical protein [Candidatus Lokiarchaeota archaeon]